MLKIVFTGILTFLLIKDSNSGLFSADDLYIRSWNNGMKTVTCLKQTSDGFIWFGTPSALIRFDGLEFEKFSNDNTPAFNNNNISVLYENKIGELHIGTNGGGLIIKHEQKWRNLNTENGLSDNHVRAIITDWHDNLWVGTDFGLNCITQDSILIYSRENGLYDNIITALDIGPGGNLLAGTFRSGIHVINNGTVRVIGYQDGLTNLSVTAIRHDQQGTLWVATMGGLYYLPAGHKNFLPVKPTAGVPINDVYIDSGGTVWYASMISGLVKINGDLHLPLTPDDDFVHCVIGDDDGTIWAGTDTRGLLQLKRKYVTELKILESPAQPLITAIDLDKDGHLWTACRNIGLFETDTRQTGRWFPRFIPTASRRITAILHGPGDQLWLGSEDQGLLRIRDQQNQKISIPELHITCLGRSPDQSVWIGTPAGIYRYPVSGEISSSLTDRRINSVCTENDHLLVATNKGIFNRTDDGFQPVIPSLESDILTVCRYDSNTILAGTAGIGLLIIRDGHIDTLSVQNGLPVSHIYSIIIGQDIWLTSLRGIIRIPKSELDSLINDRKYFVNCIWYDESDGMVNAQCQPSGARLTDNILYVPTAAGLAMLRTDREKPRRNKPHIRLKRVRTEQGEHDIYSKMIEFSADTELMEIYFASIDYNNMGKQYIQYQVAGFDPQLRLLPPGNKQLLTYHNLPSGNYTLHIMPLYMPGRKDRIEFEIAVVVPLPFYKNPIFLILLIMLSILIFAGGYIIRSRRIREKIARKYSTISIDQERTERVAADLQKLMTEKKPYLDPGLALKDLAKELNIHPNYLSRILNEFFRQPFNDFINEYRISAAMKMLGDPDRKDQTILQIMYETGFYSKSVFNTAFKKLTGITPSAYRNGHLF